MSRKRKYFTYEESPNFIGRYVIKPVHEMMPLETTRGSYNVLPARIMCLGYADYLRMCRDVLGAEVTGKFHLYPVPYFKNDGLLHRFLNLLDGRVELLMWEREHPDFPRKEIDYDVKL